MNQTWNRGHKPPPIALGAMAVLLLAGNSVGVARTVSSAPPQAAAAAAPAEGPLARWAFDEIAGGAVMDTVSGRADPLTGNYRVVAGAAGRAVKFDGYTTAVTRNAADAPRPAGAFTVSAWLALAAYPWNWCPVVSHQEENGGYALEIGPDGELAMKVFTGTVWRVAVSTTTLPLRAWVHVAGAFDPETGLTLYVGGAEQGRLAFQSRMTAARRADLLIGSTPQPLKPALIHREFGTLPDFFSLDAIVDEVEIRAIGAAPTSSGRPGAAAPRAPELTVAVATGSAKADDARSRAAASIAAAAARAPGAAPEIAPRVLPAGPPGPGRFGAYFTDLKFYWEWDDLWRTAEHPDVVVQFDGSPVRLVFWRGTRYSPSWVSENNLWMADQSIEAWNDDEGCFEHMQDRHCVYSHVRVIENTPARVVVHWRYAPVSAHDNHWRVDPRTGWGCWVDEYYYIYPDQTAVRNYTWEKGTLGRPRQFQESIPLTSPGQLQGDVIDVDYVTVANLAGETQVFSYVENPGPEGAKAAPENPSIQRHNFKSKNKPFILFEPGGQMRYLRDMNIASLSRPGVCSHWPVGQMRCDGRTQRTIDRATSFLGFPITSPVVHEGDTREWVNSLYGMNDKPFDSLVPLARSWARAPGLRVEGGGAENGDRIVDLGYDMAQRAYVLERKRVSEAGPAAGALESDGAAAAETAVVIAASPDSPLVNACLLVKNGGDRPPSLTIDGAPAVEGRDVRFGFVPTLDGTNLLIWIARESTAPVRIAWTAR